MFALIEIRRVSFVDGLSQSCKRVTNGKGAPLLVLGQTPSLMPADCQYRYRYLRTMYIRHAQVTLWTSSKLSSRFIHSDRWFDSDVTAGFDLRHLAHMV